MRGVVAALLDRVPDRVPRTHARFFDVANACACAAWIVLARDALREKRSARARRFVVDGAVATLCAASAWLLVACVAKGVDARDQQTASHTHLRAHHTGSFLGCRPLL